MKLGQNDFLMRSKLIFLVFEICKGAVDVSFIGLSM